MGSRSVYWQHFKRVDADWAECSVRPSSGSERSCAKKIKVSGGSTKGLQSHLRSSHKTVFDALETATRASVNQAPVPAKKAKIQTTIHSATENNSLQMVLSRLAAKDGLSLNTIANSYDIRQGLIARGYKQIPNNHHTVREKILGFHNVVVGDHKKEIQQKLNKGETFSLSFDEWTSIRNRRYMCMFLHAKGSEVFPLGLVRVDGSATAPVIAEMLTKKAAEYGVKMETDIVALICDGASVNKAVARIVNKEDWTQLCLAHGIHLAVCDVLYNQSLRDIAEDAEEDQGDDEEEDVNVLHTEIADSITKLRTLVKFFRRSPMRSDKLSAVLLTDGLPESTLKLDTKTRWDSILAMISAYLKIRPQISKVLIDMNETNKDISTQGFSALNGFVSLLEPVAAVVKKLCERELSLYVADQSCRLLIQELETLPESQLKEKLLPKLKQRLAERKTVLWKVISFLVTGQLGLNNRVEDKNEIAETISKLWDALGGHVNEVTEADTSQQPEELSFQEKLRLISPQSSSKISSLLTENSSIGAVKREINFLLTNGTKGVILESVESWIDSIRPSSVEAERCFSAAGLFATKLRSRTGDNLLSALQLLKMFFVKKEKNQIQI